MEESINDLVQSLIRLSNPKSIQKNFHGFIKKICLPYFKNIEKNTQIPFDFPLTAFIGQNGCGKSSVLQSLYGCPNGLSTGKYWFNTATDPIAETDSEGNRPCFWFEYYNEKAAKDVQVIKLRIQKPSDPDYWEPSRPVAKYGMNPMPLEESEGRTKTRWEGLEKKEKTVYLDFRSELS
ncbi:MAG TPA: AAA family ATPase, partial [Fibrobacteraceae bacterium]|nr:AAA family ATPase [Fibrobacteraceae bacterium]